MKANDTLTPFDPDSLDRREFLRLGGTLAAAGALASAGCQPPQEATVPFHDMPESLVDGVGRARFFTTVLDGAPVVVKTREGRPILAAPNRGLSSGRGLTLRHHATLMDLYDPDRAKGPVSVRRGKGAPVASSWAAIGTEVVSRLQKEKGQTVLLTGPVTSPSLAAAIAGLAAAGVRHVAYSPIEPGAPALAWQKATGSPRRPRPALAKADLIVGLGAAFLDGSRDGLDEEFALRRVPDQKDAPMNRFVQFESRLSLTGANADTRIRVRDSHLPLVAAALAHEVILGQKTGPLASVGDIATALAAFSPQEVSKKTGVSAEVLGTVAKQLAAATGEAVVLAGGPASESAGGPALEIAVHLLNLSLDAYASGLLDLSAGEDLTHGTIQALGTLTAEMLAGKVTTLIIGGSNPVYDAPASLKFAEALAKVPFVVSLNDRLDETSLLADYLAPTSHPLECWGDEALPKGLLSIQQPCIQPLHDTQGLLDVLVLWGAAAGAGGALEAALSATKPAPGTPANTPAPHPSAAWHFIRGQWAARLSLTPGTPEFDSAWNELLRSGSWQGPVPAAAPVAKPGAEALALLASAVPAAAELELELYPHTALYDGKSANNGWLQEFPDPITRISWGGAVSIAPKRFDEMGLSNGDMVELDLGHAKIVAPAYRHAGMHNDQVALPFGLGRTACGVIGSGIGQNVFPLRLLADGRALAAGLPVKILKTGKNEPLAFAQGSDVIDRDRRPLVPATTLTAYEKDPKSGTEQQEAGPSIWPEHPYKNSKWSMAIDLSKCNGCGKCVIGCQAENNIPVVGRRGILDGREMSWIRIDRYYDAPKKDGRWGAEVWDGPLAVVEEPTTLFEPMLCQHCDNAPCESVCPFVATMHSEDGLNQQIYNRCVGTRYCANNCPFKVRRFNFWEYSYEKKSALFTSLDSRFEQFNQLNTRKPMQMKNNPEVTVRMRGVMEKCSFCVQRIREARAQATRDGKKKDHFPDGAVIPACMEACPAGAITFGDLNAPGAKVKELSSHPRAMRLLEALGVKPSISYLTKVRNDKA
ncbi:MAG: 4Fe-4S dicluster domain-containing protein [Thermoanaerobaculia bacterium]|nr:4Fe-4S dicluster domain-containing protein [Thermoanaerobaculia bacterium]